MARTVQDYNTVFNPEARIERVQLSNGSSYFVVDDALVEPERMVRFAVEHLAQFRNVDFNAYPGVFLLTSDIAVSLSQFFNRHIRCLDRVPSRGVRVMDLGKVHSCSVDHCGQPSGLIVAQGLESFKLHVASLQLPLVVLLEQ